MLSNPIQSVMQHCSTKLDTGLRFSTASCCNTEWATCLTKFGFQRLLHTDAAECLLHNFASTGVLWQIVTKDQMHEHGQVAS